MAEDWQEMADAYDAYRAEPTKRAQAVPEEGEPTIIASVQDSASPPIFLLAGGAGLLLVCLVGSVLGLVLAGPFGLDCRSVEAALTDEETGLTITRRGDEPVRVCLDSIARSDFLQGDAARGFRGARGNLPNFLDMTSPMYVVDTRGEGDVSVEIPIPEGASHNRLDLYTWSIDRGEWIFVPSKVNTERNVLSSDTINGNVAVFEAQPTTPLIATVLENGQTPDEEQATLINIAFAEGLTLRTDGAVDGQLIGGWTVGAGYAVVPLITAEGEAARSILAEPALQAAHINDLLNVVASTNTNGIALDYRGLEAGHAEGYGAFLAALGTEMDEAGKLLVVVVPAATNTGSEWDTAGYDYAAIGRAADLVVVDPGVNPQDFAIGGSAYETLAYATRQLPRQGLLFLADTSSIRVANSGIEPVTYTEAITQLGEVEPETVISDNAVEGIPLSFGLGGDFSDFTADQTTGAYTFNRSDGTQVWVVTANTVRARLDMASEAAIGGMVVGGLFDEGHDATLTTAVAEFKAQHASSIPSQLMMRWTVTKDNNTILTEIAGIGTPFVWQPPEAGDYTVNGSLVGSRPLHRGSVAVKVGDAATPEPATQVPPVTNPDTPTSTPSPTKEPPSTPPPSVGGGGGDGGPFEVGAQVPNAMVYVDRMQSAGMNWVKFQMKYGQVSADTAGSYVAAGRGSGFKVLISVTGVPYPDSIDYEGAVAYMGQVASYQPDAIEVWNEQNYVFEWPAGQIDGKAYVDNLLAPSFNAIKAASPTTLVIIGAPTPTGVNDPNIAIADDIYIRQMAAAGAGQYANCLGVHYNAGATSAYAREGHPGGGHHSWYYQPSLEVYYNAIGAALPLCITEIGYVTDEGFDSTVPDNFAWARDTTVAQQAQWLGEAKAIARDKGYVRMMIVFNVGFTTWTSTDPQGGYSIVRPDGSCPACSSLAGS